MENYKKFLVLANDKADLKNFAKRQETIFQLENAKSEAFNVTGPTSHLYITTSNKLFELYFEDEDYEEALDIAKELFEIVKTTTNIKIKSEAIVNLGLAYLRNGNITSARKIANKYTFNEDNPQYPQYCLFRSNLSAVYKDKEQELLYLNNAYNYAIKNKHSNPEIGNTLLAIALYYERNGYLKKAYDSYLQIFNKASEMSLSLSDEERFSFLIRLSNLSIKNNNEALALDLLNKSKIAMNEKFKPNHPLIKVVDKTLSQLNKNKES